MTALEIIQRNQERYPQESAWEKRLATDAAAILRSIAAKIRRTTGEEAQK